VIVIGIDPGITGALSVHENSDLKEVTDMPVMPQGKKNKQQVNAAQLGHIIKTIQERNDNYCAVVEQVQPMPMEGVTSSFNFGQTFGIIKGALGALKIPVYFVQPRKWKKHFNLIGAEKDASRTKAIELYPSYSNFLSRKKDINRAEAILIGRFFIDGEV